MHNDILKLAALVLSCLFYAGVACWFFRDILSEVARRLQSGWRALTSFGRMAVLSFAGVAIVYGGWKPSADGTDWYT